MNKSETIKLGNLWLDCYGPTKDEIEWTADKAKAFRMTHAEAVLRIETVLKFYPLAERVNL